MRGRLCGEIAQDVLQDAAILEVGKLVQRVDAAEYRHFLHLAVGKGDFGDHLLARADILQPVDLDRLLARVEVDIDQLSFAESLFKPTFRPKR